ncbi:hypothetical protein PHYSODRAFT_340304 [Phytophthora sojae]|uniref:Transmembrane protein n=1 Tax=Phytophthora sojae (strain P6497) TaxID=1094619 RepID=G5A9I5_PHYSP|nr:hypothetical protein PHYSODRAFT_340304 [Phytophthora sojae]EGZ08560.1 hypothetical protein PHYSODRAFT_340304 [Phytophthora sojae]|eukprot:XP_009536732.1 hypothetical protein PHYSODRAFT_340304 [Phytophthora sojae]
MDPQAQGGQGGANGATSHSTSSFMPASLPAASSDYLQQSLTTAEAATAGDMARTNALADRNTIVDMSLRLGRFVLCVVAALVVAFSFALLTSNKKTLTHVDENKLVANETLSAKASSVVEDYNTLFGHILFAGGKVFEVFCETLIFPTLATYLHNCSLYPGDQPVRVHSAVKARCIFWGLKTVIILMNVGFTSVYVGQTTEIPGAASRRLAASREMTTTLIQTDAPLLVKSQTDALDSILRTSMTGQWRAWADDVDTTSVSFSFPSHAWNTALVSSKTVAPTSAVEIPLRDYLANREKYAMSDNWDPAELYLTFQEGVSKLGLASVSVGVSPKPQSFDDLVHVVASELKAAMPSNTQVGDLVLRLERRELADAVRFTSLTVSIPVDQDNVV